MLAAALLLGAGRVEAGPVARVVLVGDSTMAPGTGYGDALCGLFKPTLECVNLARGGRSTRSYRADGSWARVISLLEGRPGDRATHVLLQFGHNDQPGKAERSTDLETEFPANLGAYVDELLAAGAHPVLVTPLTRRSFDVAGHLRRDLAPWAQKVRDVARARGLPLVDLYADSVAAVEPMGQVLADTLAQAPPPDRRFDRTHLGPRGAALFARMVARRLRETVAPLAEHLVVGAIEPEGRAARPQLRPEASHGYSYAAVLGSWDPLRRGRDPVEPAYVVDRHAVFPSQRVMRTVQEAVDAALRAPRGDAPIHVRIRPGSYDEVVYIPSSAPPITLAGEPGAPQAVRIATSLDAATTSDAYAQAHGPALRGGHPDVVAMFDAVRARPHVGTAGSAVVWVRSRGFEARDITIENVYDMHRGERSHHSQAVALLLDDADEAHLSGVRLLGGQDTFYLRATSAQRPARTFVHRSHVEGDMDFIFGEATAYFLDTEVRTRGDRAVSYALAPSTHYLSRHGFVFERCRFTSVGSANARAGVFKLARQWARTPQSVGKVAILRSSIGAHIDAARPWGDWSVGTKRERRVLYDSDEYWDQLLADGVDPARDLGYPARPRPAEPFLVEFENVTTPALKGP